MHPLNLIRVALRALQRNKLRAFLTMLGIIIGVAAVIAMVAIGQGSKQSIHEQLSSMGSNMITVQPASNNMGMPGGVRLGASSLQTNRRQRDPVDVAHEELLRVKATGAYLRAATQSGQVVFTANAQQARDLLLQEWLRDRAAVPVDQVDRVLRVQALAVHVGGLAVSQPEVEGFLDVRDVAPFDKCASDMWPAH